MIDAAVKIIDRLISLAKERQTNNRKCFIDHIEPLYLYMTEIHCNYRKTFDEIAEKIRIRPLDEDVIQTIIKDKKSDLEHLRIKVNSFVNVVEEKNTNHFPDEANRFIESCCKYFQTSAGRSKDYHGHYSELIDYMNREKILNENDDDRMNDFGYKLFLVLTQLNENWNNVTFSYAEARVALLR